MTKKHVFKKYRPTDARWDIAKRPSICKICDARIKRGDGVFIVNRNTIGYPRGTYCNEEKEGEETCAERVYGDYVYGTEVLYHKV
jgi:hypothetical protein